MLFLLQGQAVGVLAQQEMSIAADHGKHGVIGKVAAIAPAGLGAVVIDFAEMLVVAFLQKNTALVVGVHHEDFAPPHCILPGFVHTFGANVVEADVDADMASHTLDKINFVKIQSDFSVLFAAAAALSAGGEKGIECACLICLVHDYTVQYFCKGCL